MYEFHMRSLRFPPILRPCLEDFCSRVTIMSLKFLIRRVIERNNSIWVQLCIPIFVYASLFKVIYFINNLTILTWLYSGFLFLFTRHKFTLNSGTYILCHNHYILTVPILTWLIYCCLFKFTLVFFMRHILVGRTNISFCERLNFNPFMRTFVHFTIVFFT